jgi:branched-chain amino acid aminotransferase
MKVWNSGIIQDSAVETNSLNYTMHYASPCAWEGIRAYKQADGETKIFRLKQHVDRLFDSAKIMNFEIPHTKEEVMKACLNVSIAAGGGDLYLRPIAYSVNAAENAKPQLQGIKLDIYCFPIVPLHSEKPGIRMCISSFRRGYPQYQMQAKSAANYNFLQTVKHEMDAGKYDDVFLTDNDGYITEATVANVWVFKNGVAMTPPNDGSILPGVTRQTVSEIIAKYNADMALQPQNQIFITEKKITRADLYTADCIILCGTYAEIVNVAEVDGRKISTNHRFYQMLVDNYQKLVRGA